MTADTTYFQLPSGASHGTSTAPSGNKGVTGGLTDSGGANDIHAVGISALALLQLQRASSLAPAPAPLPNIRELTPAQVTKSAQVARHTGVAWTVLAAVQRLGRHKGQSLTATGNFLRTHGARGGADSPFRAEHALAAYFGSKEKGSAPRPSPPTTGRSAHGPDEGPRAPRRPAGMRCRPRRPRRSTPAAATTFSCTGSTRAWR